MEKMETIVDAGTLKELDTWRNKYNKRQMKAEEFLGNFYNMMKKISLKSGYEIFPHLIRTMNN